MGDLRQAINDALNRHSAENASNTPDWILAQYLLASLAAFDAAVNERERYYGRTDAAGVKPERVCRCVPLHTTTCPAYVGPSEVEGR